MGNLEAGDVVECVSDFADAVGGWPEAKWLPVRGQHYTIRDLERSSDEQARGIEMATSDLKDAFNLITGPAASCAKAYLGYKQNGGREWQILTFDGKWADGSDFRIVSEQIRPGGDVMNAARITAQTLLARPKA